MVWALYGFYLCALLYNLHRAGIVGGAPREGDESLRRSTLPPSPTGPAGHADTSPSTSIGVPSRPEDQRGTDIPTGMIPRGATRHPGTFTPWESSRAGGLQREGQGLWGESELIQAMAKSSQAPPSLRGQEEVTAIALPSLETSQGGYSRRLRRGEGRPLEEVVDGAPCCQGCPVAAFRDPLDVGGAALKVDPLGGLLRPGSHGSKGEGPHRSADSVSDSPRDGEHSVKVPGVHECPKGNIHCRKR